MQNNGRFPGVYFCSIYINIVKMIDESTRRPSSVRGSTYQVKVLQISCLITSEHFLLNNINRSLSASMPLGLACNIQFILSLVQSKFAC